MPPNLSLTLAPTDSAEPPAESCLSVAQNLGRRPSWPKDWGLALILNAFGVVLPALVAWSAGSLSLPQNDDWAYRRVAAHFVSNGSFFFTGWSSPTLVGQILWSWPFLRTFGIQGWIFSISTAVLAVIGISCAYYLARQVLSPARAFSAVLLLLLFPGFAFNTSTFMTDVPALAAEIICLALGVAASSRRGWPRWVLLASSLAVGAWGFSIRQFALAAPIAVLASFILADSPRHRRRYLAFGLAEFAVCALIYVWASRIPGGLVSTITEPSVSSALRLLEAFFSLALVISPAIAIATWARIRTVSWTVVPGIAVCLAGLVLLWRDHTVFVGNYLVQQGFQGTELLYGGRPLLLPTYFWDLLCLVACAFGGLLTWIAADLARRNQVRVRRLRDWTLPPAQLEIFGLLMGGGLAVYCLVSSSFFDRYLWPLALPLAALLLRASQRHHVTRHAWALGAILSSLLAITTIAFTLNAGAYSAARWQAANAAITQRVKPSSIDAGFEWNGAHSTASLRPGLRQISWRYFEPVYAQLEPGLRECALVSAVPVGRYFLQLKLAGVTYYRLLGPTGPYGLLFTYLVPGPKCPYPASASAQSPS